MKFYELWYFDIYIFAEIILLTNILFFSVKLLNLHYKKKQGAYKNKNQKYKLKYYNTCTEPYELFQMSKGC